VVRVVAGNGVEPTHGPEDTSNNVFYDEACLRSQYAACSRNQLSIQPFEGTTDTGVEISGGVASVAIDIDPVWNPKKKKGNKDEFVVRANTMATEQLGNLPEQFDLVLFCMPPGTGDWMAFATINGWDSYYNDESCGSVSAQLHEIGHNLNLAHSGDGDKNDKDAEYDDKSGYMGSSFEMDDIPKMCFNAAKNYQLGWYSRQQKSIDPTRGKPDSKTQTSKTRNFVMSGIVDYKTEGDTEDKLVVLRLNQKGIARDYYVGYNKATGFNAQTQEDQNEIVIWEKPTGGPFGYGISWKVTSLRFRGQRFVVPNFGRRNHFVEVKLLSNSIGESYLEAMEDVKISVTAYKAARSSCPHGGGAAGVPFEVRGRTDDYAYETSWSLKADDPTGGYVDFGSGYSRVSDFRSGSNLCPGVCYVFEIQDLFGDGISTGFFEGILDGETVFSGSSFGETEKKRFCVPGLPTGDGDCTDSKNLRYHRSKKKNCSWVGENTSKRCGKNWQGRSLAQHCPKTCNLCA